MPNEQEKYFNKRFATINADSDVQDVFSMAEYLAYLDTGDVTLDCIVASILFVYESDNCPNPILKVCTGTQYYHSMKDSGSSSEPISQFAFLEYKMNKQKDQSPDNYFIPSLSTDAANLLGELKKLKPATNEKGVAVAAAPLTIDQLLYIICIDCQDLLFEDCYLYELDSFDTILKVLKRRNNGELPAVGYAKELSIKYTIDMTHMAYRNKFDKIIGRTKELEHLVRILCKRKKNNPLLVGEAGVGKTHIVEALAEVFANGSIPQKLNGKHIISLNVSEMISGTKYRGDLEENFNEFIKEIKTKNAIVFIDELHMLCATSGSGANLSDMLKPHLLDPEISIIGATTYTEYKQLERDPAIARRFDVVKIEEPSLSEAKQIMQGVKKYYEEFHKVTIPSVVSDLCTDLSKKYLSYSNLPDSSIDVLDEACSMYEVSSNYKENGTLNGSYIYKIITEKTGIPVSKLKESEKSQLLKLKDILSKKVIGQPEAINKIVSAIQKSQLGLQDKTKPIATFLFAGTTGVGKTETAKVLATDYFNNPKALIRLDMSEYQNQMSVQRLVGSAPGFVGYEEGGYLTNAVKNRPHSVVLFDEIEKAHPDVLNVLLQILDDGRLTDSSGKTVDFTNTIVILTTNLGSKEVQKNAFGFGQNSSNEEDCKDVISSIKKNLTPELFNRIGSVVFFTPLTKEDCVKIAKIYFEEFKKRLTSSNTVELKYSDSAVKKIVDLGYSKQYGARELKRIFEVNIEDEIVKLMLANDAPSAILLDVIDDKFSFKLNAEVYEACI